MQDSAILNRLTGLRAALAATGADALLVSQPENRRYLSGFTGSAGWLLISAAEGETAAGEVRKPMIATDFRYYGQVRLECPGYELVELKGPLSGALPEMLLAAGVNRLAFEADHLTYADYETCAAATSGIEWVPTKGLVMELRSRKDAAEIEATRRAIALGDEALAAALAGARPGMTERELAWNIESYMRTHGAEAPAFDIIVACGLNGARPHAHASDARLVAGEPIVIDMGAKVDGYCSDLTRTVCFGQPNDPDKFWEVYNTVLRAQMAAEAMLRPGVTGPQGDAAARDVIAAAGYGDYFGHGLGHGVGLFIHELPRLARTSTDVLVPGQFVTVEPGIYLPDWGGVRIEDMVLITEDGVEILSRASKEPII